MTKEELAEELNGIEYDDLSGGNSRWQEARQNNLVIVFGYSDDNAEFRGAIFDEVGCYEGGDICFTKSGKFPDEEQLDAIDAIERDLGIKIDLPLSKIKAVWCPKDEKGEIIASWAYETNIPHSVFDVVEGNELYCKGIVFSLSDL